MNHIVTYSEIDPFASKWLESLAQKGVIRPGQNLGDIRTVKEPSEIFHAFAGIGGWELALEMAGWVGPVWTASLPCQPFSNAGKLHGEDDERHLWPFYKTLVEQHRPPVIFGEQVASPPGRDWLADVSLDLEALGYRVAAADLCAASVGAPHVRQRLFWVGYSDGTRGPAWVPETVGREEGQAEVHNHTMCRLPDDSPVQRSEPPSLAPYSTRGFWGGADWLFGRDEKWRAVEPSTFPLANGIPNRVGRLRGYGNAIVPQVAAVFIQSFMEAIQCAQ